MDHIFFIHLAVNGCLDFFHVLPIVNNAAMNIQVSFWIMIFSVYMAMRSLKDDQFSSIHSVVSDSTLQYYFTIIVLVLPYININLPQVYMCSSSWIPLPLPYPYHPSGSSQRTSPEHPISCIKPGLAICFTYGNTHVSMLFSQIIPPSPSPTESKRLFFTSVSLLLFCI